MNFPQRGRLVFLLVCSLAVAGRPVVANDMLVRSSADTTLIEGRADRNLGGVTYFNSGTIQNNQCQQPFPACRNRGLIKFDVSGAVPPGAMITFASFGVALIYIPPNDETDPHLFHDIHRMLQPWGEGGQTNSFDFPNQGAGGDAAPGEASWNYRLAPTNAWGIPGGAAGIDYVAQASASAYISIVAFSPYFFPATAEVIGDVQFWLDHPDQNYGWMFKASDETKRWTAKRFMSRENTLDNYPQLYIAFIAPPILAPGAVVPGATNGTFFQTIQATNVGDTQIPAFRIFVADLAPGVQLLNASGTNDAGVPFIQVNAPLPPGQQTNVQLGYLAPAGVTPAPVFSGTVVNPPAPPGPPSLVAGLAVLDSQSGLVVEKLTLQNTNSSPIDSFRVLIGNLPVGTTVFNATGQTNGTPFVQYNLPLAPNASVTLTVEYNSASRTFPAGRTLTVQLAQPLPPLNPSGTVQSIARKLALNDGSFLVDFATLSSRTYYVQYSADLATWKTVSPPLTGTGANVQWIDNGPPKTDTPPQSEPTRFYRVLLIP